MDRDSRKGEEAYPQAPSQEEWEAMTPEERVRAVEALPGEVTWDEMAMPEGDQHSKGKRRALEALEGYFSEKKRKVYLGSELPVYYPKPERRFAPDLLVVLDAEPHDRDKWMVSHERKGLDWVMEVHVGGDRKKDARKNVQRYARLGIPEYFIYDRAREVLQGYRLPTPEAREYVRLEPEEGRYVSRVLGLTLQVVENRLRFWDGETLLLESAELLERLKKKVAALERRADRAVQQRKEEARQRKEAEQRAQEAERRAREAEQRAQEEARQRQEAERRLAELEARVERLGGRAVRPRKRSGRR
jgi:Uma2 family endonuclease